MVDYRIILRAFPGSSWARLKSRPGQKRPFHLRVKRDWGSWCGTTTLEHVAEEREEVAYDEACKKCYDGFISLMCDGDFRTKLMAEVRDEKRP